MKDPNRRRQLGGSLGGGGSRSPSALRIDVRKPKPPAFSSARSLWWILAAVILLCGGVLAIAAFRFLRVWFRPVLLVTWQHSTALHAVSFSDSFPTVADRGPDTRLLHAVTFPDQTIIFQNYPLRFSIFTPSSLLCHYSASFELPPLSIDSSPSMLLIRCPLPTHGLHVSLRDGARPHAPVLSPQLHRWDSVAYAALLDRSDNSTVAFVKGLNLRPERLSDASRYECVFGWQFTNPRFILASEPLSVAQEIVRCRTPLSVLRRAIGDDPIGNVLVSVKVKGRGGVTFSSLASPVPIDPPPPPQQRPHRMCVCTMVRNQARFLKEWITYHARIGVQRWFIYDNGSDDQLEEVVQRIDAEGFNVTRHQWPWIKTQEAGFAHCALRARYMCEWVGFIDVDEFLYLPTSPSSPVNTLHEVLANHSINFPLVGELRTTCYSFGPSGMTAAPAEGVMVGYTCRMATPERHKSIVRPEALSPSLINVVHHFHLRDRFQYVNMDRSLMVINHYKYQVWDVFKEKFYRRVATYVADWQDEENVGSKDRAPGLGTKAVEPPDWPSRFCEVQDTGLRNWVLAEFANPSTGLLPWSA